MRSLSFFTRPRHQSVTLPLPQVGDPFPAGAADDVDYPEPGCRREPGHSTPHVAARGGKVTAVWSTSQPRSRSLRSRAGVVALAAIAAFVLLGAASCDGSDPAQNQDAQASRDAVGRIIQNQPVKAGDYSPTRDTMNRWVDTWMSGPGKRYYAYFYVNGAPIGYYVLTGPPVSYAAGATSPYHIECPGSSSCQSMPNPGQDAAFANQGSGQFQFYGVDATTKRMLEWGGVGMTYFGSDKPLPIPAPALGDTK